MKTALLHEDNELRTFAVVLGTGDETMSALELLVTELPRHLYRRHDPESGLALIDPFVNG